MKRLHLLGARKVIVVGIGPLGCIPFGRALNLVPSGQCLVEMNELIQGYNEKLKEMLNGLNQEKGPEAVFVYANTYSIVLKIILNYPHYGKFLRFITSLFFFSFE